MAAKAKQAKTGDNVGKCGKCGERKLLVHFDGNVCDDCFLETEKTYEGENILLPDEMTKEMFAKKAGVTIRAVEIWKASGKLPSEKLRRRINGTVRKTTIFKKTDVDAFLLAENEQGTIHKLERDETSMEKTNKTENDFATASQMFVAENLGKFAESMNHFTESMKTNLLPPQTEKPFLNFKEAAECSGLSENCLRKLVRDKILTKFTGAKGETMISRKQLLSL